MDESLAVKLAETNAMTRKHEEEIKELKESRDTLFDLVSSVKVLVSELKQMSKTVNSLDKRFSELESEPGKRWKSVMDKIIWLVVGGLIALALAQIGIS